MHMPMHASICLCMAGYSMGIVWSQTHTQITGDLLTQSRGCILFKNVLRQQKKLPYKLSTSSYSNLMEIVLKEL